MNDAQYKIKQIVHRMIQVNYSVVLPFIITFLLILQYVLGITINLIVAPPDVFSTSNVSATNAFNYSFGGSNGTLIVHSLNGTLLMLLSLMTVIISFRKNWTYRILSIIGLSAILAAFGNGIRFVMTNFSIDGVSYGMAMSFFTAISVFIVIDLVIFRKNETNKKTTEMEVTKTINN